MVYLLIHLLKLIKPKFDTNYNTQLLFFHCSGGLKVSGGVVFPKRKHQKKKKFQRVY